MPAKSYGRSAFSLSRSIVKSVAKPMGTNSHRSRRTCENKHRHRTWTFFGSPFGSAMGDA